MLQAMANWIRYMGSDSWDQLDLLHTVAGHGHTLQVEDMIHLACKYLGYPRLLLAVYLDSS